jgi:hypothetical protein
MDFELDEAETLYPDGQLDESAQGWELITLIIRLQISCQLSLNNDKGMK